MATAADSPLTAVLDVDGTLVDTNYQHAIAWHRALRDHGHRVRLWKIHRHIGMGGDQIVTALVDEEAEREAGEEIRAGEGEAYSELIGEVQPMDGARELIEELREDGATVSLASSTSSTPRSSEAGAADVVESIGTLRSERERIARLAR